MFKLLIGTVSVISSAFHLKHWQGFPLFQKKIPFWKWNNTEICSRIPGKFCMKWKIKFFWFTLHNPDFFLFHGMETRDFRNPDFWNVKKKIRFLFSNQKKFRNPFHKSEKFQFPFCEQKKLPGSVPQMGKFFKFPILKPVYII